EAERRRPDRRGARPGDGLVEGRREDALLELLHLHVAQVAVDVRVGAGRPLGRRAGRRDQGHSRAPRRQMYPNATPRTAVKRRSSTTAAVPFWRSTTASG